MDSNKFVEKPIAFFDSGVGGISVLATAVRSLPNERFIYYGDTANAPFGNRGASDVKVLSARAAGELCGRGCKALVVACNTATSAAINFLREIMPVPVVGMEPALKPALEQESKGMVLVMATPLTLAEHKFQALLTCCGAEGKVLVLPCTGIVELVEKGEIDGPVMEKSLSKLFQNIDKDEISSVVLGCTHYLFIRNQLAKLLPQGINYFDGNGGTVKQLHRVLDKEGLLRIKPGSGSTVEFYSSGGRKDISFFGKMYSTALQDAGSCINNLEVERK